MPRLALDPATLGQERYGAGFVDLHISVPAELAEILRQSDVGVSRSILLAVTLWDALTNPTRKRVDTAHGWLSTVFPDAESMQAFTANLRYLAGEWDRS